MPTFSYKGYDFDVDHTPTEQEFAQMSAYVDTLPPKQQQSKYEQYMPQPIKDAVGGIESIGRGIVNIPSMAHDAGISLAAKSFVATGRAGNKQQTDEFLNSVHKEIENPTSLLGKFVNAIKVKPFTKSGEVADDMLGTAFVNVARAAPAAVQAAFQGTGQSGAQDIIHDETALGPLLTEIPLTLAALVAGGKALPGQARGLSQFAKDPMGKSRTPKSEVIPEVEQVLTEQQKDNARANVNEWDKSQRNYQPDLFQEDILAKQREQAQAESEGIIRDSNGPQGDLFAGQGRTAPDQLQGAKPNTPVKVGETGLSEAFLNAQKKQKGSINPEVFKEGFEKIKELASGTRLLAFNEDGKFKIAAFDKERPVAIVEFNPGENLSAESVIVQPSHRGSGLPAEMYRFASELGNDIVPGEKQTTGGKKMWDGFAKNGLTTPGQTMIGKSQRGSVGLFGKTPQEKFAEQVKKQYPDITEEQIQKAWELKQANVKKNQLGGPKNQKQALDKLPWYKDKLNQGLMPIEDIQKAKESLTNLTEDISDSNVRTNFTSGGVVQAAIANHPVTSFGINLVNGLKKQSERLTTEALSNVKDGVLTLRQHLETVLGAKQFGMDFAEFVKASLDSEYTPKYSELGQNWVTNLLKKQKETLDRNNAIRKQLGLREIHSLDNYFSLMREGPFGFTVKDSSGKLLGFIRERTLGKAEAAHSAYAARMAMQGITDWVIGTPEYYPGLTRSPFKKTAQQQQLLMSDLVELLDPTNPNVQKAMEVYKKSILDEARGTAGAKNREKFRAGVQGAKGTKDWLSSAENVKEGMESIETFFRQLNDQTASLEAMQHLREVINDTSIEAPNAKALTQSYYDHAFGRNDIIAKATEGLVKLWEKKSGTDVGYVIHGIRMGKNALMAMTLGFANIRFLATQLAQPWQVIPSMLSYLESVGANHGSGIKATFAGFQDSVAYFQKSYSNARPNFQDRLSATIWDYAEKQHITAAHLLEQHTEYSNSSLTKGAKILNRLSTGEMVIFEGATRMHAFSTFVRFLVDNKVPIDTALKLAENLTEFTMTSYELHNKPQIFAKTGLLGELASSLQTYKFNQLGQQYFYARHAFGDGNLTNIKAKKAWATQNAIALTFAGALGLYGLKDIDNIMEWVKGSAFGKLTGLDSTLNGNTPSEWLLKNAPEVVSVGALSSLTGLDFHSSFAGMNIIPDSPSEAAFSLSGKLSNMGEAGSRLVSNPTMENLGAFAREPINSLSGLAELTMLSQKNPDGTFKYINPKDRQTESVRTKQQAATRAILGFKPLSETLEKKREMLETKDEKFRAEKRSAIMTKMVENIVEMQHARQSGNNDRLQRAQQRNQELFKVYVQNGGDPDTIDKSIEDLMLNRSNTTHNERTKIRAADSDSIEGMLRLRKLKELNGR